MDCTGEFYRGAFDDISKITWLVQWNHQVTYKSLPMKQKSHWIKAKVMEDVQLLKFYIMVFLYTLERCSIKTHQWWGIGVWKDVGNLVYTCFSVAWTSWERCRISAKSWQDNGNRNHPSFVCISDSEFAGRFWWRRFYWDVCTDFPQILHLLWCMLCVFRCSCGVWQKKAVAKKTMSWFCLPYI